MYCKNCGAEVQLTDKFCPACGSEQDVTPEVLPSLEEKRKDGDAGRLLKKSITGAVFSFTVFLSLVGWIMSASARRGVRAYKKEYGELTGRALAAKIVSGIGLGFGIGFTLYIVLVILIAVLAAA